MYKQVALARGSGIALLHPNVPLACRKSLGKVSLHPSGRGGECNEDKYSSSPRAERFLSSSSGAQLTTSHRPRFAFYLRHRDGEHQHSLLSLSARNVPEKAPLPLPNFRGQSQQHRRGGLGQSCQRRWPVQLGFMTLVRNHSMCEDRKHIRWNRGLPPHDILRS